MNFSAWNADLARDIVSQGANAQGPLLPILHEIQRRFGFVPDGAVDLIADALNLSRAEVYGVVSFYPDFRSRPPGTTVVRLCRAEACQAAGGREAASQTLAALGVSWGGTTVDGAVTIEPVYCLGLCAVAPAALIDDAPLGRLTAPRLLAALRANAPL